MAAPAPTPELLLLDTYLKQLRLPMFVQHHRKLAEDAARANLDYAHFLFALAEQEIQQRAAQAQVYRLKAARLPVLKDLAAFDFSAIPQLNQAHILELARGTYIPKAEPVILLGNPGLGKTHPT